MCPNTMILNTLFGQRENNFSSLGFLSFPSAQTPPPPHYVVHTQIMDTNLRYSGQWLTYQNINIDRTEMQPKHRIKLKRKVSTWATTESKNFNKHWSRLRPYMLKHPWHFTSCNSFKTASMSVPNLLT